MTKPVPVEIWSPNAPALNRAANALRAGALVAFPTETVYGLGADATQDSAVATVFEVKQRPRFNPLIVHTPTLEEASRYAVFHPQARTLAEAFWPGPLTLVLPRLHDCPLSLLASAGMESVALRVPDHPLAQALLRATERPLAAPSANASGKLSPTRAHHVQQSLKGAGDNIVAILDGGACPLGLESTVIGFAPDAFVLRPGALPRQALEDVLGVPLAKAHPAPQGPDPKGHAAPGQLASHYAPDAPLRLNVTRPETDEILIRFGSPGPFSLSPSGDLREAATRLFATLREADARAARTGQRLAVMPIPGTGLGEAINDRLQRASFETQD